MTKIEKPLLAGTVKDYSKIIYPIIATPKLDGIRCLMIDNTPVSRNFKKIPNKYISRVLPDIAHDGMDGELLLSGNRPFNEVSSAIMSFEGEPDFEYHVFDFVNGFSLSTYEYQVRLELLQNTVAKINSDKIIFVPTQLIENEDQLLSAEENAILSGYEGLMIRNPAGIYKFGRSSEKERILLKIKRFEDSEAEIIGFEEKRSNQNEKTTDAFGYSARSSKKEGIIRVNTLGKFFVKDIHTGVEFSIGSGFTDEFRDMVWADKDKFVGKIVKYKFQPAGVKDSPRFPVFLGFRHKNDI